MRVSIFALMLFTPLTVSAQWQFEEHTDLITDEKRVFAQSNDAPIEEIEDKTVLGRLEISCLMVDEKNSSNTSPAAIYHTVKARNHHFGDVLSLIMRVDKNEPIEFVPTSLIGIGGGKDKDYVRMASGSDFNLTKRFISELSRGETLVVRSVATENNTSTFVFSLTGINDALANVFEHCGLTKDYPDN